MSNEPDSLTIAVPIRNEAATLRAFLSSLALAVGNLPKTLNVETLLCLNGCTDNSLDIARQYVNGKEGKELGLRILESEEGKITAQRMMIRQRKFSGPIVFIDADLVLDPFCLKHLWDALHIDAMVQIVYALPRPCCVGEVILAEWLQSIHYQYPEAQTPRYYLHGRCFILRNPDFLVKHVQHYIHAGRKERVLTLNKGPLIDDVYLSRVVIHTHGLSSIACVPDAIVYFTPPRTVGDYYRGTKRLAVELYRLDRLFPEHRYLQQRYFRRRLRWSFLVVLPLRKQLHLLLYTVFERMTRIVALLHLYGMLAGLCKHQTQWEETKTTKSMFLKERPC